MKLVLPLLLLSLLLSACSQKTEVDRIFINGVIHTGVEAAPLAEAVAVDAGR
ncbi:hypothetical protein MNBD_ALPHA06-2099, partial [hydrothermal vent metagenome]